MKVIIESLFKRPKAPIVLGDQTYFFTPVGGPDSAHVAEVTDPDHIGTLLAIKEGYRVYQEPEKKAAVAQPEMPAAPPIPASPVDLSKNVEDVEAALEGLSEDELKAVREAEVAGKNRKGVLSAIDELLAE